VRVAQLLRLPASQRHYPRLGLYCDRRLLARAGTVIERRHRSIGLCALDVASDLLMMHSQGLTHRTERRVLPIGQQHPRPLDTTRGFRARARNQSSTVTVITRVSRAIWTAPREAERTRRACGIRTP